MGDKVLFTIRKSRKAFLLEYGCATFLFMLVIGGLLTGKHNGLSVQIMGGLGIVTLISAEFSRQMMRYNFTDKKIIEVNGLFKQTRKNVYFHPLAFVPDLNVKQGRLQRLLGIGSIYLKGGHEEAFEIMDVSQPHKVLDLIEEFIEKNKRS